jgi:hypothetical protein
MTNTAAIASGDHAHDGEKNAQIKAMAASIRESICATIISNRYQRRAPSTLWQRYEAQRNRRCFI